MGDIKRKTILFITDTHYKNSNPTGAHRRFLELVRGIAEICKVVLVSREIPQLSDIEADRFLLEEKGRKNIPEHIDGMIDLCKALWKLKNVIKYDYAIAFGPSSAICYKWCGYKNIISLFREDLIGYQKALNVSKLKIQYSKWMEKTAVLASDKIIVQCENDKKNLINRNKKYEKNLENKVFIQLNNINTSWMEDMNIEKDRVKDGKIRILFIGGFSDRRKGHDILFPAIVRLLEEGVPIELLVAGDGIYLKNYKEQYDKYDAIKFLGRVDNMSYYLSSSDFEIVPSLIDSCPNTVLEGINAGIAVYGSNTGGIPDLLRKKKYLFDPNSEDIYLFLKRVIQNSTYISDSNDQKELKEALTFDWVKGIYDIIVGIG